MAMTRPMPPSMLATLLLASAVLQAAVVPGRWEKLEQTRAGTVIVVSTRSNERVEATLVALEDDALVIDDKTGQRRRVPRGEIRRVESPPPKRSRRATWIGLAIGAGAGAAVGAAGEDDFSDGVYYAVGISVGAAVGTVVGLLVDRLRNQPDVLYQANP